MDSNYEHYGSNDVVLILLIKSLFRFTQNNAKTKHELACLLVYGCLLRCTLKGDRSWRKLKSVRLQACCADPIGLWHQNTARGIRSLLRCLDVIHRTVCAALREDERAKAIRQREKRPVLRRFLAPPARVLKRHCGASEQDRGGSLLGQLKFTQLVTI